MDRRLLPARRHKVHSDDTFKVFVVLTFRHLFDQYVCLHVRVDDLFTSRGALQT